MPQYSAICAYHADLSIKRSSSFPGYCAGARKRPFVRWEWSQISPTCNWNKVCIVPDLRFPFTEPPNDGFRITLFIPCFKCILLSRFHCEPMLQMLCTYSQTMPTPLGQTQIIFLVVAPGLARGTPRCWPNRLRGDPVPARRRRRGPRGARRRPRAHPTLFAHRPRAGAHRQFSGSYGEWRCRRAGTSRKPHGARRQRPCRRTDHLTSRSI